MSVAARVGGWGRVAMFLGTFAAVSAVAYFGWLADEVENLEVQEAQLAKLKDEYLPKKKQALGVDAHRAQLREVEQKLGQLMKAFPTSYGSYSIDVMQMVRFDGVRIDNFQAEPDGEVVHDVYAQQAGNLRITGPYADVGRLASAISGVAQAITLRDIRLEAAPAGKGVTMDATITAYRYLTDDEIEAQRKARRAAAKRPAKK